MALAVVQGSILAYRVFDAGDTIDLDGVQRKLPDARRLELAVEGLLVPVRPVEIDLPECAIDLPGQASPLRAKVSARLFDFGVMSMLYEIAIAPGTTFGELIPLCDALYDSVELDARGVSHRAELVAKLRDHIAKPHDWCEAESFTIVFAQDLAEGTTVEDLRASETIAKLLLGERSKKALSREVREDVLKNAFSYLADDLVIVDWNSALVVEPSGSRIVPHVLELATSQLLEFRYYDGLLDRELTRVHDDVERAPRLFRSPFSALTREVVQRYMDLTEFTERVDNAIKSVGDFYLARVYLAAIRRFRVPEWRDSVETKLALVGRAYELLKGEVEVSRTQLLELTVVVLILVEVVAAFRAH